MAHALVKPFSVVNRVLRLVTHLGIWVRRSNQIDTWLQSSAPAERSVGYTPEAKGSEGRKSLSDWHADMPYDKVLRVKVCYNPGEKEMYLKCTYFDILNVF